MACAVLVSKIALMARFTYAQSLWRALVIFLGMMNVGTSHCWEKEHALPYLEETRGLLPACGRLPHGLCRPRQRECSRGSILVCAVLLEQSLPVPLGALAILHGMTNMAIALCW